MTNPTGPNDGSVDIQVNIRSNEQELNKTKRGIEQFRKTLGEATDPKRARELQQLAREFAVMRDRGLDAGHAALQLKNTLDKVGATRPEIAAVKAEYERLTKSIQATRREAEAAAKVNARGRGRSFLTAAGQELRALPAIDTGLGFTSDVIGKLAATLGALPPAALAGTAATAALVAAIAELSRRYNEQKAAVISNIEAQARLQFLSETTDRKTIERLQKDATDRRAEALNQVELADQIIANFLAGFENAAHREINAEAIQKAIAGNFKAIVPPDVQGAIDVIKSQGPIAEQATIELIGYNKVLEDADFIAREAAAAQDELNKKQQSIIDKRIQAELAAQLTVGKMSGEAIEQRLADINREQAAILSIARAGEIGDEALDQLTQRTRDLAAEANVLAGALSAAKIADAMKALTSISDQTVQIAADGEEKIAAIRKQGAEQVEAAEKRLADARQKLVDFNAEAADKTADASRDFMSKELERTRKFNKDLERAKEDSNRRLLQLGQQLEDKQLEATLSNDTGAFLRAQREFDRAADQEKTELDVQSRRRLEDFQEESRRNQELLTEKLAALDTEAAKRRQNLEAEIAEQDTALAKVKANIDDRVKAEQEAIRKSLQDMVNSFDTSTKAMTGISQQAMAILQQEGINVAAGIVGELRRQAGQYTGLPSNTTGPRINTGVTPTVRPIGFANGGIITKPTLALMGERPGFHEALIPFRASDGISGLNAALAKLGSHLGAQSRPIQITIGDIVGGATPADLQRVKETVVTAIMMADHASVTGVAP